jgi:hypothetical protein
MEGKMNRLTKLIILTVVVGFTLTTYTQAALFFNDPEREVKNFTDQLPRGYDDPDVIYGREVEQPRVIISHMAPLEASANEDFNLSATVKNLPEGGLVLLHYRFDKFNQYRDIQMNEITPGRYASTITAHAVKGDQLQYYVEVTFAGTMMANSGDFGNPHQVNITGAGQYSKYGLYLIIGFCGFWLLKKVKFTTNSKSVAART